MPPIWATLAVVPGIALCIWAGNWQLERRDAKTQLFAEFDAAVDSAPLGALVPDDLAPAYRFRRFAVRGRYDSSRQILLDSMVHDGQVGYQVLTPLLMGTTAILVNRGWVAADTDRSVLPAVEVGEQPRYVRGRLDFLREPGIRSDAGAAAGPEWPRRLLYPTSGEIERQLGIALYDYQLLLDEQDADGFTRDWRPQIIGPERHFGYAVQWFGFAVLLLVLYIVMNRKSVATDDE